VKAEEANRYLGYLGCEPQSLDWAPRPGLRSTKHLCVVVALLCALILVGMAVYAARPGETSVALVQVGQSVSEDVNSVASPLDLSGSSDATGPSVRRGQNFSYECVGPWYPILVGLLASPGG
jgi:hypothetical protein